MTTLTKNRVHEIRMMLINTKCDADFMTEWLKSQIVRYMKLLEEHLGEKEGYEKKSRP